MVALDPYPRGFVIFRTGSAPELPDGWVQFALPATGWSFSHDHHYTPEIAVVPGQGNWVLVHGLCLHADSNSNRPSPSKYLAERLTVSDDHFLGALDYLGGRHLILRGGSEAFDVFHDAAGMRSVYYSPAAQLISSHLNLINQIHDHPARTEAEGSRALTHSWDSSRYVGIGPLLPNHYLDSQTWNVHRFFPRQENRYTLWTLEEKLTEFRRLWQVQMESLVAHEAQLVMSITGGADSRTSLALSTEWINDLKFFTYTAKNDPASKERTTLALDVTIVEQIKALIPLNHKYFKFEEQNRTLQEKLDPLLSKNTSQRHSRWLVAHHVEAFPQEYIIHLRGNGYEIGRAHWGATDSNSTIASLRNLYFQLTKANKGYVSPAARNEDFDRGINKWSYNGNIYGYHLRDIFYWEIRSGRWLAEILNETDIAFQTCVPLNVRSLIEITLSFPVEQRAEGYFFAELINAAHPVLNFPGKNDPRNLYELTRDKESDMALDRAAKDAKYLQPEMIVSRTDGTSETLECDPQELYIPAQEFTKDTAVRKEINLAQGNGTLTFCVSTDYFRTQGRNHWEYQIVVDGQIQLIWDGAIQGRDVHVAIDNVGPETKIQLTAVALQNQAGKSSWEKASRTALKNFTLWPRGLGGASRVSADASEVKRPTELCT